jgi:hypothetical protein
MRETRAPRRAALAALAAALALLALTSAPAQGKLVHGFKENLGQGIIGGEVVFSEATALAFDQESDTVLVVEAGTDNVRRFKANGEPAPFSALGTNTIDAKGTQPCTPPSPECDGTPQQGFNFESPKRVQQVAVDNSGGANDGNIYVTQQGEGALHLVDIFDASGAYLGQLTGKGATPFGTNSRIGGVAVDEDGNVFVSDFLESRIYRYEPAGKPPTNADFTAEFASVANPGPLAAGMGPSAGALFVNSFDGRTWKLKSTDGSLLDPEPIDLKGLQIAVDPGPANPENEISPGHLYVGNLPAGQDLVKEYDVTGETAAAVSEFDARASIWGLAVDGESGEIYVSGAATNRVKIFTGLVGLPTPVTGPATVIGDTMATLKGTVDAEGRPLSECFFEYDTSAYNSVEEAPHGTKVDCEETASSITGTSPVLVHADVAGLEEETKYHFRLVAANSFGFERGKEVSFKTPSEPVIVEEWSADVTTTTASAKALVNPENAETTYFIEWGPTVAYGNKTPTQLVAAERDEEDHEVSVPLAGLQPGVTYHWRAVAENDHGKDVGEDRSFTTFNGSPLTPLPDGRVYELVSPVQKNSGEVGVGVPGFGGVGGIGTAVSPQQASPDGEAISYHSATAFGDDPESGPATSQYFSRQSGPPWATENVNPPFEEGYLRDPVVGCSEDLSHAALIVVAPELAGAPPAPMNMYWRDNSSGELKVVTNKAPVLADAQSDYCLSYAGTTADSGKVFFAAKGGALLGEAASKTGFNLYEWNAGSGALAAVSVLPNGAVAAPSATTAFGSGGEVPCLGSKLLLRHAVSADGARVFWTYGGSYEGAVNPLFARVGGTNTRRLDAPNTGVPGAGGGGRYWDAATNGTRVFFASEQKLTTDSAAVNTKPDLYRYDFGAAAGNKLTDLSVGAETANVLGVIGASADGTRAYFVASGALTGAAVAGKPNLYAWTQETAEVRFIATLGTPDTMDWSSQPIFQTARLSSDGRYLAFLSSAAPTGYDSTIESGEKTCSANPADGPRCLEAYLYDFETDSLLCASCNPSGSRPLGASAFPTWSSPNSQPRYLSADGNRLFFTSHDALALTDTNGQEDVYEWERAGTGSCNESDPTYSPTNGGCLLLLSSGSDGDSSHLLDASTNGNDVFLSTRQKLVHADQDDRFDVYDARVGGSVEPPTPVPCEGEGCRAAASRPEAPLTPGTPDFVGPPNPPPPKQKPCKAKKAKKGKGHCKKAKGKGHRRHRAGSSRRASR